MAQKVFCAVYTRTKEVFHRGPSARPCCRSMNSPIDPPIARSPTSVFVDSNTVSLARLRAVCDRAEAQDGALLMPLRPPQNVSPVTRFERTCPVHPRARNGPSDEPATRGWSEMPSADGTGTLRPGSCERPFEGDPVLLLRRNSGSAVCAPARFTSCVATSARRARAPRFFLRHLTLNLNPPPKKRRRARRRTREHGETHAP